MREPTYPPKGAKKPPAPPGPPAKETKASRPREYTREVYFIRDITVAERGATKFTLRVEIVSIDTKPPALTMRMFKESPTYSGPTRDGLVLSNWEAAHELMDALPDAALAWAKVKG